MKKIIYAFFAVTGLGNLMYPSTPAWAGHWQVEYATAGGSEYNLDIIQPNAALSGAGVSGSAGATDTAFDAGRSPLRDVLPNSTNGFTNDVTVEVGSGASFYFEAGYARGRTEMDGGVSAVFRWVKDNPADKQPPPTVLHVKEYSKVVAHGMYEIISEPASPESYGVEASNGLGSTPQYEEGWYDRSVTHGYWQKTAEGEKAYEIPNPLRLAVLPIPTRAFSALSYGGIVKPSAVYGETWGPHLQLNALYRVQPDNNHLWVTFEGKPRACAGAVLPLDTVHTFLLTAKATQNGSIAPHRIVKMKFDLSGVDYSGMKPPKFVDSSSSLLDELLVETDDVGEARVKVLSSDLISKPSLFAIDIDPQTSTFRSQVSDKLQCDFGQLESKRRFAIKEFDQGGQATQGDQFGKADTGWEFDTRLLFNRDSTTAAKLYLKFRQDPRQLPDQNYFLVNGGKVPSLDTNNDGRISDAENTAATARTALDDATNWVVVSGHKVRIRIDSLIDNNDAVVAANKDYVYFTNAGGQPLGADGNPASNPNTFTPPAYVEATTDANGVATVYLKAGELMNKCRTIKLKAVEQTQKKR